MKKKILILTLLLTTFLPIQSIHAINTKNIFPSGKNTVNAIFGFPYGMGIEYERQLSTKIPLLKKFKGYVYGSRGSSSYADSSIKTSSFGVGIRTHLLFGFFIGFGFNSSKLTGNTNLTKESQGYAVGTKVSVTLTPKVLSAEFGYRLSLGPVSTQLSVGIIPGQPKLRTKISNKRAENIARDALDLSLAEIKGIPTLRFSVGFNF